MDIIAFTPAELLQHDQSLIAATVAETLKQLQAGSELHDKTLVSLTQVAKDNNYKSIKQLVKACNDRSITLVGRPYHIERRHIAELPKRKKRA